MKSVLLASPCGPFDLAWGADTHDLFSARLSRGQGAFTMVSHCHYWGLHLIAENIRARTTVLENPHVDEFEAEVKKGYDLVGIQLKSILTSSVAKMVASIRRLSPRSKIVIGGYGVSALFDPVPDDSGGDGEFIRENADHFCREEGVRFMRRLIGDEPVERPITQYHLPMGGISPLSDLGPLLNIRLPTVLSALGCPNGCEFCNTSQFFHQKKIRVADPEECHRYLLHNARRIGAGKAPFHIVWDEDFLIDADYSRALGKYIRSDLSFGPLAHFSFASIRSISQFDPDELVENGIAALWIGVESTLSDLQSSKHQMEKRTDRSAQDVFDALHERGIATVGSSILGFDFHTRDNIMQDIEHFVSLQPVFYQVAPLTPCPGTKLYKRLMDEGRIKPNYGWKDVQIWKEDVFEHWNFAPGEIHGFFDKTHDLLVKKNGPSLLRMMEVYLNGYARARNSRKDYVKLRGETFGRFSELLWAILPSLISDGPSPEVKEKAKRADRKYRELFGRPTLLQQGLALAYKQLVEREARIADSGKRVIVSDPPARWAYYDPTTLRPPVVVRQQREHQTVADKVRIQVANLAVALEGTDVVPTNGKRGYTFDSHFAEIEGSRLHFVDEGEGPVLVLLHGNPTWSYLYRHLIRGLATRYRCVAPDLLGYGLSDKPEGADYSMRGHIRRLAKLVEKLGLREVTPVMQDWGGIIGLGYAVEHKENIAALVVMNTAGFLPHGLDFLKVKLPPAMPFLWSLKIPGLGELAVQRLNLFVKLGMRAGIHNRKKRLAGDALDGFKLPFPTYESRRAILESVRQIPMTPLSPTWHLLREIEKGLAGWDVPTQIIWGMRDPVFTPWFVQRFESLLTNHRPTVKLENASHFLQDDDPEPIIEAIVRLMEEHPAARGSRAA